MIKQYQKARRRKDTKRFTEVYKKILEETEAARYATIRQASYLVGSRRTTLETIDSFLFEVLNDFEIRENVKAIQSVILGLTFNKIRSHFRKEKHLRYDNGVGDSTAIEVPSEKEAPAFFLPRSKEVFLGKVDPFDFIEEAVKNGVISALDARILLQRAQGVSYAEISKAEGLKIPNLNKRLFRAKRALVTGKK